MKKAVNQQLEASPLLKITDFSKIVTQLRKKLTGALEKGKKKDYALKIIKNYLENAHPGQEGFVHTALHFIVTEEHLPSNMKEAIDKTVSAIQDDIEHKND